MEHKVSKIKLSPEIAQQKIMSWCAYQERSQHETRQKLYEYGLHSEEVEAIISNMIAENFLNEERFSIAFASGKFRIKNWGRIKIKAELKKHKVSDYCINKAMKSIDTEEYEAVIRKVIEKKLRITKSSNPQKLYYSLLNYLMSRGFESDLVRENLSKLHEEKS
jgi:regulatory protein